LIATIKRRAGEKGKPRITAESSDPVSAFVACLSKTYGFPLMTALVLMLMVLIVMRMLVGMFFCYMFMVVTIMRMGHFLVLMLVLMLILVMATHSVLTSFRFIFIILPYQIIMLYGFLEWSFIQTS
jgi:hypothetical protein